MLFKLNIFARRCLVLGITLILSACQLSNLQSNPDPDNQVTTATTLVSESVQTELPVEMKASPTEVPTPIQTQPYLLSDEQFKSLRNTEISIIHPWIDEQAEEFEDLISEFNSTNEWNISVIPKSLGGFDAVAEYLSSEDEIIPDIVIGHGYDLAPLGYLGKTMAIGTYISDPLIGVLQYINTESMFAGAFPVKEEMVTFLPIAWEPGLIFYNQTWANELGFESTPSSLEDLRLQLYAGLQANLKDYSLDNNGTGGLWISDSPTAAFSWYSAFSSPDVNQSQFHLDDASASKGFMYLKTLYLEDSSWNGGQSVAHSYFSDRLAIAYEGGLDDLIPQEINSTVAESDDSWITISYPTKDGSGSIAFESVSAAIFSKETENQNASWLFLRWLLTPEIQSRLVTVHGYWPVVGNPAEIAPEYVKEHPAWASAITNGVKLTKAPETKNWAFSRLLLQDAVKRLYLLDAAQIPTILDMLDNMLTEIGTE